MVLSLSVWFRFLSFYFVLVNKMVSSDNNILGDNVSKRWRNNQYIRDDGILPYQMCDAAAQFLKSDQVVLNVDNLDIIIFAASVWGKSADTGEPKRVEDIELAVFPKREGSNFDACCGGHAFTHINFADTIIHQVLVTCVLSTAANEVVTKSRGFWNYTDPTYIPVGTIMHPAVMSLHCPVDLQSGSSSFDKFIASDRLKLSILLESPSASASAARANASLDIPLCYEHVVAADQHGADIRIEEPPRLRQAVLVRRAALRGTHLTRCVHSLPRECHGSQGVHQRAARGSGLDYEKVSAVQYAMHYYSLLFSSLLMYHIYTCS